MIATHNLILDPIIGRITDKRLWAVYCTCGWKSVVRFSGEGAARRRFAAHVSPGPVVGPAEDGRARGPVNSDSIELAERARKTEWERDS